MRTLITGAGGLLGHALSRCLAERGDAVWGAFRQPPASWPFGQSVPLDLLAAAGEDNSPETAVAQVQPDLILHVAALTDVDCCEIDPDAAAAVNAAGSGRMASAAATSGARLVYMSTDYVFDGEQGRYQEQDPPQPINCYGQSKLAGEAEVLANCPAALVIRGTFYGLHPDGRGGLARLLAALRAGQPLTRRADSYFTPLPAPALARRLTSLAHGDATGVRHLPGPHCSRWHFARAVADAFGLPADLIQPGLPQPAPGARRPRDTSLTTLHPGSWPPECLAADVASLVEEAGV